MKKDKIKLLKDFLLGIFALALYFILSYSETVPFDVLNIDIESLPKIIKYVYMFAYEIFIMGVVTVIFYKKIDKDFNEIKKNHKEYFSKYFKYYLVGLLVMYLSNCIIMFVLKGDISSNEEAIRSLFKINPIYIYFSSIIFAPYVEELVFRQGIKNIIPFKIPFILISGFVFGGLHVIASTSSIIDLLYIIPYSSLGIAFAYILYKSDNIFISMGYHFLHNGILISLQFLILLFS